MMLPNRLVRSYLIALDDILGTNGVNTILNHSGLSDWIEDYPPQDSIKAVPYESFSRIQISLEDIYGDRMGQNLSRRASRISFKTVGADMLNLDRPESSESEGANDIKDTMHAFIALFDDGSGSVKWSSTADEVTITYTACPNCVNREAQDPVCHACAGWIEGLVELLGIGDNIEIQETTCLATGSDQCSFTIQPGRSVPVSK
jgi:predicted hydrocarbon binding protein